MNMHKVVIVPDSKIENLEIMNHSYRRPWSHYKFLREPRNGKRLIVAPYKNENTSNFDLFKLGIYCQKHNIHLIGYGTQNKFSLLSLFSSEVLTINDPAEMTHLYGHIGVREDGSIGAVDISNTRYHWDTSSIQHVDAEYQEINIDGPHPITQWLVDIKKEITDDEILEHYTWLTVYVRQSTYELYEKLTAEGFLPKNCVWCECRYEHHPICTHKALEMLKKHDFGIPTYGLDEYAFQNKILERVGTHYMGIQILCSLFSNCFFFCMRGSSNLFSVIPAKVIGFTDAYLSESVSALPEEAHKKHLEMFDPPHETLKKIMIARYGPLAEKVYYEPWNKPHEGLVEHLKTVNSLIDLMRDHESELMVQ